MPENVQTIYVTSSEALLIALQNATGGETISLKSGDYGDISFSNLHFSSTVTITSEEPLAAKFSSIIIDNSENLQLNSIEVDKILGPDDPNHIKAVSITNSSNIEIINSDIHGSVDNNFDNDGYGIFINMSSNITLSDNDIHDFMRGSVTYSSQGIDVINNEIFDIRSDGFDFVGVQNVNIQGNNFTNFYPNLELGDHADGIQFWNTIDGTVSGNVVISDNTFLQGDGNSYQSIFIENNIAEMGYYNFTITDNLIYNGSPHGISFDGARDTKISNNTVLQHPDGEYVPGIMIGSPTGQVEVSNNVADLRLDDSSLITALNNVEPQNEDSALPTYYGNLFFDPFAGTKSTKEDFMPKPGSLLDTDIQIGALDYSAITEMLEAQISVQTFNGTSGGLSAIFNAQYTTDYDGNTNGENATYHWDFGDDTTGEGINVEHTYASEGDYNATLTVTRGGISDSTTHTLSVTNPHLMDINDASDIDPSALLTSMSSDDTSLIFDGTEYLNFGRPTDMFGLDELYLSFDINPAEISDVKSRIFWNHSRYTVELQGDDLHFMVYTDGGTPNKIVINNVDIFDGNFHNIAMSFDGENGTIVALIDGVEAGSIADVTGSIDGVGSWDITVGGTPWGNNFNGEIKNIDVWSANAPVETIAENLGSDATDAQAEAEALAAETEALAAALPTSLTYDTNMIVNIADGDTATEAGYTAHGNAIIGTDKLIFDGKGFVSLGQEPELFDLDAFTISFDLTASNDKGDNNGTVYLVSNQGHYDIKMSGDDLVFRIYTDTGEVQTLHAEGVGIRDASEHNIIMSYDSATGIMSGYVDGVQVAEATGLSGSIPPSSGNDLTIGGPVNGRKLTGEIDNFTMWNDGDHTPDTIYAETALTIIQPLKSNLSIIETDSTLQYSIEAEAISDLYDPNDYWTDNPYSTLL